MPCMCSAATAAAAVIPWAAHHSLYRTQSVCQSDVRLPGKVRRRLIGLLCVGLLFCLCSFSVFLLLGLFYNAKKDPARQTPREAQLCCFESGRYTPLRDAQAIQE